jgi:HEAT repeat protein
MKCNVGAFLSDAFSCADSETRCSIAYLCGEMDLAECVPLLVEGMNDSLPAVRKASLCACGRLAHTDLIPSMVRALHDFDPDVRDAAADAFANITEVDRAAVEQVAEELLSAVDPEHRRHSALLFGALADVEKLSLLMKDDSVEVRKTAVTSLASLKNRKCTGHLIMALVDENPDVRIAAASALVETAGSEALEPLLLLLNDDDQWVQCTALRGLGKLKGDQAFCAVEGVFESAKGALMIAAIESLGTIGGDKASTLLEKALNNDDEEVVKTAMEFLAREGDWWVEKHLDALLRHSHWGVRNCFIKVLADLWQGRSVPYLSQALAFEHDDLVRKQIREALGRCL